MKRRDLLTGLAGTAFLSGTLCAQQKGIPVIGYLDSNSPGPTASLVAAFRWGLSEAGYIEGQNVKVEYRWAEGRYERLPNLASELVQRKVDMIATSGGPASAQAAKAATATIPIAFVLGTDPVDLGLVASLSRPGGNLTGVSMLTTDLNAKRLELLLALISQVRAIALLVNPNYPGAQPIIRQVQEAARATAVQVDVLAAGTTSEIDTAFDTLAQLRVGGLVVGNDPFFDSQRELIVGLTARHAIPAIYSGRQFPESGGLISYGTSLIGVYRQHGLQAGSILNGAKPANLPVQQPTTFELIINLKTAKSLGLTVPQSLLARADEVIE